MPRPAVSLLLAFLMFAGAGCPPAPQAGREGDFAPTKLRVHPTFTQVKDWTGDGKLDGIEAVIELLDSYGEPTRGNGSLMFELWSYRPNDPAVVGTRVAGPWRGPLLTREDQDGHWSKALRAYTFQLEMPNVNPTKEYVLTASFEPPGGADKPTAGGRLFDRLVIEPAPEKKATDKGVHKAGGSKRESGLGY
jgi:hypothetical protein